MIAKLRAGSMPPPGRPRPDARDVSRRGSSLERDIDRAWAASPNPGRTAPVHRLNRAEYNNAIRDLFALDRLRREAAAARRRDRGRQLRQLRRRPLDFDGPSRTLPVGRPPGHAAGDRPASGAPGTGDLRDSAARHAGRSAERGSAARFARRHRRPPRLSGRRRVPRSRSACSGSIRTISRAWAGRSSSTCGSTASC